MGVAESGRGDGPEGSPQPATGGRGRDGRLVAGLRCMECGFALGGLPSSELCPGCFTPLRRAVLGQAAACDERTKACRSIGNCVSCGYRLAGLLASGHCPECGTEVRQSLRGWLLQHASPAYLVRLHRGLSLVLYGMAGQFVLVLLMVVTEVGRTFGTAWAGGGMQLGLTLAGVAVSGVVAIGYWLVTEPDPQLTGLESPRSSRVVLRVAVVVGVLCAVAGLPGAVSGAGGGLVTGPLGAITEALYWMGWLAWVTQIWAMLLFARLLARRVPDSWVVGRSEVYVWLLPVVALSGLCLPVIALVSCCLPLAWLAFSGGHYLGLLVALAMYWNLLHRLSEHVRAIVRTGEPARLKGMMA